MLEAISNNKRAAIVIAKPPGSTFTEFVRYLVGRKVYSNYDLVINQYGVGLERGISGGAHI